MKAEKELETTNEALPEDGSIDKIRDILFGVQVRDFEHKFAKLEERFGRDLESLREDTRIKLDQLEEYVSKEISALTDKIYEEQDLRSDAIKNVTSEMQRTFSDFESKLAAFGERVTKNEIEIRSQILEQSKSLSDSIQRRQDEIMSSMEKETRELRDDKADRAALADLFTEMAIRLSGEFNLPDSN